MKIGFHGHGAIGSAISSVHEGLGQTVIRHDLNLGTDRQSLLQCDVIFICLPSPQSAIGKCDLSIIDGELHKLNDLGYRGIVVMKSTVPPGTGVDYSEKFEFTYVSCPEFLREHQAIDDYLSQKVHIIGTVGNNIPTVLNDVLSVLPGETLAMDITDAELTKYFHNTFNAWRIVFANAFNDLSTELAGNYDNVLNAFCNINNVPDDYLKSNPKFKGFGGPCLPKDTAALAYLANELSLGSNIWSFALEENAKRKITLPEGLRENGYAPHDT